MPTPTPGVGPPGGVARPQLVLSPLAPLGVLPLTFPGAGVRTTLPGGPGVHGVRVPGWFDRGSFLRLRCGWNSSSIRCGRTLIFHTPTCPIAIAHGEQQQKK